MLQPRGPIVLASSIKRLTKVQLCFSQRVPFFWLLLVKDLQGSNYASAKGLIFLASSSV